MNKKFLAISMAITLSALVGVTTASALSSKNNTSHTVKQAVRITAAQATAAALSAQPGTTGKTELEDEDGKVVYGVEVTAANGTKYDVKVDANTGKVLKIEADEEGKDEEKEDESEDNETDDGNLSASITAAQATTSALTAQPGTVGKAELEDEDGKAVYGIEVTATNGTKYDVKVDANTGKVLKIETDDEGDEKHEGK